MVHVHGYVSKSLLHAFPHENSYQLREQEFHKTREETEGKQKQDREKVSERERE
jgi:hypothetical protein